MSEWLNVQLPFDYPFTQSLRIYVRRLAVFLFVVGAGLLLLMVLWLGALFATVFGIALRVVALVLLTAIIMSATILFAHASPKRDGILNAGKTTLVAKRFMDIAVASAAIV